MITRRYFGMMLWRWLNDIPWATLKNGTTIRTFFHRADILIRTNRDAWCLFRRWIHLADNLLYTLHVPINWCHSWGSFLYVSLIERSYMRIIDIYYWNINWPMSYENREVQTFHYLQHTFMETRATGNVWCSRCMQIAVRSLHIIDTGI